MAGLRVPEKIASSPTVLLIAGLLASFGAGAGCPGRQRRHPATSCCENLAALYPESVLTCMLISQLASRSSDAERRVPPPGPSAHTVGPMLFLGDGPSTRCLVARGGRMQQVTVVRR